MSQTFRILVDTLLLPRTISVGKTTCYQRLYLNGQLILPYLKNICQ